MDQHILEKIYEVLLERKKADPKKSYVASLYAAGVGRIAEKITEEAAETTYEAVRGRNDRLKEESADLIFHLMVLWAQQGIKPDDVFSILEKRFGIGGHEEKAARPK